MIKSPKGGKNYKLNKRLTRKPPSEHNSLDVNGNLQFEQENKANIFVDTMENQYKTPQIHDWINELVTKTIDLLKNSIYPKIIFYSLCETLNIICRFPNTNSPGPDLVSNSALKYSGKSFISRFCKIYNSCLRLTYFLKQWKETTVIFLLKLGKDSKRAIKHLPTKHHEKNPRKTSQYAEYTNNVIKYFQNMV